MNRYLTFYKVIELGSFSKAAQALGYSQSAVSQMASSLEHELGVRLINRSRTGATRSPHFLSYLLRHWPGNLSFFLKKGIIRNR